MSISSVISVRRLRKDLPAACGNTQPRHMAASALSLARLRHNQGALCDAAIYARRTPACSVLTSRCAVCINPTTTCSGGKLVSVEGRRSLHYPCQRSKWEVTANLSGGILAGDRSEFDGMAEWHKCGEKHTLGRHAWSARLPINDCIRPAFRAGMRIAVTANSRWHV
jgi:hypothetical protein